MAKKLIEDMKSKGVRITQILKKDIDPNFKERSSTKRSQTRDVKEKEFTITPGREDTLAREESSTFRQEPPKRLYSTPRVKTKPKTFRRVMVAISSIAILCALYFLATVFESAKISVIAKQQSFNLDHTTISASTNSDAPVHFELMIVSNEEYKDFTLSNPENVSLKAKGTITLYNAFATKPQKLLIHTFVADEKGKTYQTDSAVVIPGYKLDASKKIIPGQVDVGITAFLPGDSYNGSPKDLTITGFKGTAKASKIYAKLKTPLVGGAQGIAYTLSPDDKGTVNAFAQSQFKSNLLNKVNAEVPAGYILYPNALNFTYSTEEDILSPTPNAKVKVNGTISSVIINENDLSRAVMKKMIQNATPKELDEIRIPNISKLAFSFKNSGQGISKDLKQIDFNLTGSITALWAPDITTLQSAVIGARKTDLIGIFKSDPGISSATASIFPPWKSTLPNDSSKIHISVK